MTGKAAPQADRAAPWLSVIGLGEDGLDGLAPAARDLLATAQVLVGGARHLAMVPQDGRERLTWTSPLSLLLDEIQARRGQRICVLATGDPMAYGVGVSLAKRVAADEMVVIPGVSAFSLAAARLGWNLAEVETLTLHGRPLALLEPAIQPGNRLLILSEDGATPAQVCRALTARGFGPSRVVALAHMEGSSERHDEARADAWPDAPVADLNTLAVECRAGPEARVLPRTPGLPDEVFRHDGQMTKRETRAMTLAQLAPGPGQLLWDVGAGCGSVAIEWLRAARGTRAVAIERKAGRLAMIAANATALGTPQLRIVQGEAPGALDDPAVQDLGPPDAVFIGGGTGAPGLIEACWSVLAPGGRLVANVVTLEGEAALQEAQGRWGGGLVRIAVSRAEPVGRYRGWRPSMPVTQWSAIKP